MAGDVLDDRALNRATLARQLLLERAALAPADAVSHLVGLQAQNPLDPYLALWSRLDRFDPHDVGRLVEQRDLVRIVVMRGTIHLVTAGDALELRPLMQPVLDAEIRRHPEFGPHLAGVDLQPALAFARAVLAAQPLDGARLRAALGERFPDLHAPALAYACRCLLPLVQVPPRGVWGRTGAVRSAPLDAWIGCRLAEQPSIDAVILRYLAAFGPATVADAAAWSRLTGLGEVFERLRPRLRAFRDGRDRAVYDVPDAPRPDRDTPAPVRFLPEYDNALLSHADRSRFGSDPDRRFAAAVGPVKGTVLVGGVVGGIWHDERPDGGRPAVVVEHRRLTGREASAVESEGHRVATFRHGDGSDVRLVPLE